MTDELTTIADRYVLFGEIASGGMATVHFGRLLGIGGFARTVAIKRLHAKYAKDPDFLAMLLDEARIVARIQHPNVVQTLDVVQTGQELFLVMEYVHGESLGRLIKLVRTERQRVPAAIASSIAAGILHGLHAAHEARSETGEHLAIVHRDVSPQNVLVGADGVARLVDFGVAKAVQRIQTTREGQLKGKLAYMAPEQLLDQALDARCDVYAASVVLWEALAGARLFSADNEGAMVAKVLAHDIAPPSSIEPSVPPALDAIVMKGLARDPAHRFRTAQEMAVAIEACGVAPASEVGAWVRRFAAKELAERQATIAEMESRLAPSSLRQARDVVDSLRVPAAKPSGAPAATSPPPAASPPTWQQSTSAVSAPSTLTKRSSFFVMGIAFATVITLGALAATAFLLLRSPSPTNNQQPTTNDPRSVAASATPPAPAIAPCPATMISIPGGKFFMGRDDGLPFEKPEHQVTLDPYCIDVHEVTVEDYVACSDKGECKRAGTTNAWSDIKPNEQKAFDPLCNVRQPVERAQHPINCVDWESASRYCKVQGKRLPTEAEWEFAARGPDGRRFPWGDEIPTGGHLNACGKECVAWGKAHGIEEHAMYGDDDGFANTAPVGSFPSGKSRYGVEDVVGNVWEWVADRYGPYVAGDATNPTGPSDGDERVIRGGAWNGADPAWVRPTFRYKNAASMRSYGIGFRCAK